MRKKTIEKQQIIKVDYEGLVNNRINSINDYCSNLIHLYNFEIDDMNGLNEDSFDKIFFNSSKLMILINALNEDSSYEELLTAIADYFDYFYSKLFIAVNEENYKLAGKIRDTISIELDILLNFVFSDKKLRTDTKKIQSLFVSRYVSNTPVQ